MDCETSEEVEEDLDVTLRLHETAHHSIGEVDFITSSSHGWDDGVIGSFTWSYAVWVTFREDEAGTSVLEGETTISGDGCGSKSGVCIVNKKGR